MGWYDLCELIDYPAKHGLRSLQKRKTQLHLLILLLGIPISFAIHWMRATVAMINHNVIRFIAFGSET